MNKIKKIFLALFSISFITIVIFCLFKFNDKFLLVAKADNTTSALTSSQTSASSKIRVDIKANDVYDKHADVQYGDTLKLSWTVTGMSDRGKCVSSWNGAKKTSGSELISTFHDANIAYTLTCTDIDGSSGADTVTAGSVPKISLGLANSQSGASVSGVTAQFATASTLVWQAMGTDNSSAACTGVGIDPNWSGKNFSSSGSFNIGVISSTITYSLECKSAGGKNQASLIVKAGSGNCAFLGNNTINAAVFCVNKLSVLNNGNNIDFRGSFVAADFSLPSISKNIRFYYQTNLDGNWPPGFESLNLPKTEEVKNN